MWGLNTSPLRGKLGVGGFLPLAEHCAGSRICGESRSALPLFPCGSFLICLGRSPSFLDFFHRITPLCSCTLGAVRREELRSLPCQHLSGLFSPQLSLKCFVKFTCWIRLVILVLSLGRDGAEAGLPGMVLRAGENSRTSPDDFESMFIKAWDIETKRGLG